MPFRPHRIGRELRPNGHHPARFPDGFPLGISLFRVRCGETTRRLSWHERLEVMVPLDGPVGERMGDRVAELEAGDLLVVDHLTPHNVVDRPGLDTRVVVLTFLPGCVYGPGSPPSDYGFLLPFHRPPVAGPRVLRSGSPLAPEAHLALRRLLESYFCGRLPGRYLGCKAWLMVLLAVLAREFHAPASELAAMDRHREQFARLRPAIDHVRTRFAERLAAKDAAAMCGMSLATFERATKRTFGMTFRSYVSHVRMSHAVELLEGTREPIAAVAARLGFSDQSHFDRQFRKFFGHTPSDHRNGHRDTG
jgi:AraC-like DNA-binding protein